MSMSPKFEPVPTALSLAMFQAGIVNPGYALPGTHMSVVAYIQSGGPFGAFRRATYVTPEVTAK